MLVHLQLVRRRYFSRTRPGIHQTAPLLEQERGAAAFPATVL